MSVLTGFFPNNAISSLTYQGYNASISIVFYAQATHEAWLTSNGIYNGSVTNNLPVSVVSREISGSVSKCWWDDFYNRVHISPSLVNVENILVTKTYPVEVWSAYTTPKLLSSIAENATDGIALSATSPVYFGATESKVYDLTVTLNGPSTINASYSFVFPEESPQLKVMGSRSVLWPFIPEENFEEKLEWKTDIIKSQNKEQRLALRQAPRQIFSHKFLLDEKQFSKAKAIASQWSNRTYGIPVWSEVTLLQNGPASGATSISFDTRYSDYRNDGLAVLWESDKVFQVIEIDTVSDTGITLKTALEQSWGRCHIAPVRLGRTFDGVGFTRSADKYVYADAAFNIADNIDLADEGSFVTYRDKPVMTDRTMLVNDLSERMSRNLEYFDNGSGPVEIETTDNILNYLQNISFIKNTKKNIWELRQWVHARKGKQKGFWLPSWNADITIVQDVSATDTQLIIEGIGYPLYYNTKDIMIVLKNSTRIFTRAVSANNASGGNEQLVLNAPIGTEFDAADVDFACFLSYVRFDTDSITFTHKYHNNMRTAITVKETPEE